MIKQRSKANTNINGLGFENDTLLSEDKIGGFIKIKKNNLRKYMSKLKEKDMNIKEGHGCKEPDEIFINTYNKKLVIIEKKFQKVGGSACEKIQTCIFKKDNFEMQYPNYQIILIYVLSDWFKENCESELEYLIKNDFHFFFGNKTNYKNLIKQHIENI